MDRQAVESTERARGSRCSRARFVARHLQGCAIIIITVGGACYRERAARGAQIKQAIKNTACSDAAASPWELQLSLALHAWRICMMRAPQRA
jgi:hypothetical protein